MKKTTLIIDDGIYSQLKAKAASEGKTISELVEAALRLLLEKRGGQRSKLPPLPSFRMKARADVADRNALYALLDER